MMMTPTQGHFSSVALASGECSPALFVSISYLNAVVVQKWKM